MFGWLLCSLPPLGDSTPKPGPDSVRDPYSYRGGYYTRPALQGDSSWTVFGVLRNQSQLSARNYGHSRLWWHQVTGIVGSVFQCFSVTDWGMLIPWLGFCCCCCCCLSVAWCPSNIVVYPRSGSALTVVRAATLREKLQIKGLSHPALVHWLQPVSPSTDPLSGTLQGSYRSDRAATGVTLWCQTQVQVWPCDVRHSYRCDPVMSDTGTGVTLWCQAQLQVWPCDVRHSYRCDPVMSGTLQDSYRCDPVMSGSATGVTLWCHAQLQVWPCDVRHLAGQLQVWPCDVRHLAGQLQVWPCDVRHLAGQLQVWPCDVRHRAGQLQVWPSDVRHSYRCDPVMSDTATGVTLWCQTQLQVWPCDVRHSYRCDPVMSDTAAGVTLWCQTQLQVWPCDVRHSYRCDRVMSGTLQDSYRSVSHEVTMWPDWC